MGDRIHIKDLLLRAIVGINLEEREKRQDVLINIVLEADLRPAGESDQIEDAVNYRTITKQIIQMVEGSSFFLVEKMAAEIARICLEDRNVQAATVRVEKPGALRFARSVGVEIHRRQEEMRNLAYISLGSNIDAERNLPAAVAGLAAHGRLVAASPVYETRPVGKTDQANFLNAAVLLETELSAEELKTKVLASIECELGRVRTDDKNAPRTIDLDISLFNDQILNLGGRQVPDPEIFQYAHVARPLADLAPAYCHPETGQALIVIAKSLPGKGLSLRPDVQLIITNQDD